MKILFVPASCIPFHGKTLMERPLGGIETGVIRLAEALVRSGHDVTVTTPVENPPLTKPLYLPQTAMEFLGPVDVIIAVREWTGILLALNTKRRLFWSGDSHDQLAGVGIGDQRLIQRIDAYLAVSNWHADTLAEASGFPREKIWVIRNGIAPELFTGEERRERKRLIYSSTPYRGLQLLPPIISALQQRHPDLSTHIFSGFDVYTGAGGYEQSVYESFETLRQQLMSLPNCTVYGNVLQHQLAREFLKSAVLAYPNTFEETSCITALEAQAARCPIVTSARGALPETVGKAGILIAGEPGSPDYIRNFTFAIDRLLTDNTLWQELSQAGRIQSTEYSWDKSAERLLTALAQSGLDVT